jgi:hypothetical protein
MLSGLYGCEEFLMVLDCPKRTTQETQHSGNISEEMWKGIGNGLKSGTQSFDLRSCSAVSPISAAMALKMSVRTRAFFRNDRRVLSVVPTFVANSVKPSPLDAKNASIRSTAARQPIV